jgi:hypothetical protein
MKVPYDTLPLLLLEDEAKSTGRERGEEKKLNCRF